MKKFQLNREVLKSIDSNGKSINVDEECSLNKVTKKTISKKQSCKKMRNSAKKDTSQRLLNFEEECKKENNSIVFEAIDEEDLKLPLSSN